MKKEDLPPLSVAELQQKVTSTKTMIVILAVLFAVLLAFQIRDYLAEGTIDTPIAIITLCTFGGLASVFSNLKTIQEEIQGREA